MAGGLTMSVDTKFIACIFESDDLVEIRILPRGTSHFIKAQQLHSLSEGLNQANSEVQHIYFGANPRKREGGKAEDVALARCLFADFDNIEPKNAVALIQAKGLPSPTCTLDSGHGLHAWWRLDEPMHDLKTWTQCQKQLIAILQ